MIQENSEPGHWTFAPRLIDDRHGAIHLPPVDWNGDGIIDFITGDYQAANKQPPLMLWQQRRSEKNHRSISTTVGEASIGL